MVTKKEINFLHGLLAMYILLGLFTIASAVFSIINIFQNDTMTSNIIELICLAFHLVVIGFLIMVVINSFKKGSFFIRGISYSAHEGISIPVRVVSIIGFALGVFLLIIGILFLTPSGVYDFHFPITTKWLLVDGGLLLMVFMGSFFIFPFLFAKNPTLSKKEEAAKLAERKRY